MNLYAGLSGYLEISLWGNDPEKVINMAMSRGLYLWNIRQKDKGYFILNIRLGGYKALRHIVRRSSCHLKIMKKKGLPFWIMKAKRRKVLVSGVLLFCCIMYLLSSFVWSIEICGNKIISADKILLQVQSDGLRVGAAKFNLNRQQITETLLKNIPELAWANIHIQGTKVIIEVAEKKLPPSDEDRRPAHLYSCQKGRVEELLILTGTAQVKEGDDVQRGQVLIAGYTYPQMEFDEYGRVVPEGEPEEVRARGLIRALVKRSRIGKCLVKEEILRDTGLEKTTIMLKYKDKKIIFKGPKTPPYKHYRTISRVKTIVPGRITGSAVELVTIVYIEQKKDCHNWGVTGAYQEAGQRARQEVMKELPPDFRIVNEKYEPLPSNQDNMVIVKCYLETVENIGCYAMKQ